MTICITINACIAYQTEAREYVEGVEASGTDFNTLNAMYVKSVERSSKYLDAHIFKWYY